MKDAASRAFCFLLNVFAYSSTLKMDAVRSYEMSVIVYRTTRCHIREVSVHGSEFLKTFLPACLVTCLMEAICLSETSVYF
jgi:hypothetical protein